MMDRAIYLNTAVEIYKIYRNQILGGDEASQKAAQQDFFPVLWM